MEVSGGITSDNCDQGGNASDSAESSDSSADEVEIRVKTPLRVASRSRSESDHESGSAVMGSDGNTETDPGNLTNVAAARQKTQKKKKGNRKRHRKEKKESTLSKMQRYMVRKGLIESDMSKGEFESLLDSEMDTSSTDDNCHKTPIRKEKRKLKPGNCNDPSSNEVIISSPFKTTI